MARDGVFSPGEAVLGQFMVEEVCVVEVFGVALAVATSKDRPGTKRNSCSFRVFGLRLKIITLISVGGVQYFFLALGMKWNVRSEIGRSLLDHFLISIALLFQVTIKNGIKYLQG